MLLPEFNIILKPKRHIPEPEILILQSLLTPTPKICKDEKAVSLFSSLYSSGDLGQQSAGVLVLTSIH